MARRKSKCPEVIKQIDGQMSVWDLDLNEKDEEQLVKEVLEQQFSLEKKVIENENLQNSLDMTDKQQKFLEKYKIMESENLSRIVLVCGGGVLIEQIDRDKYQTLYLNREGVAECSFNKRISLVPMDKIIYYKDDMKPNELQEEKLLVIQDKVTKVLKRKGDENIIAIAAGKVISINKQGWVLEYKGVQAVYDESEVIEIKTEQIVEAFKEGETVEVEFNGQTYQGKITRIYNQGDTINCIFNNKHTAFHKSKVRKVKYA